LPARAVESEWVWRTRSRVGAAWAARLHETGLDIAHSKYHGHSAYLLQHADMPGFPREEQLLVSALSAASPQLYSESLEDLLPPWDRLASFDGLTAPAVVAHRRRSRSRCRKCTQRQGPAP